MSIITLDYFISITTPLKSNDVCRYRYAYATLEMLVITTPLVCLLTTQHNAAPIVRQCFHHRSQ